MVKKRKRPNFRSWAAYRRWLAYIHIHGIKGKGGGVYIRGKYHRPKHSRGRRSSHRKGRSRRTTSTRRTRTQGRRRGKR